MKPEGLEMAEKATLGTAIAATVMLICTAFAGANDYAFEPVAADIKKGEEVTVAVRLVHKPTGKAVPGAVIFASRNRHVAGKHADDGRLTYTDPGR
jgi:hypothetical protein